MGTAYLQYAKLYTVRSEAENDHYLMDVAKLGQHPFSKLNGAKVEYVELIEEKDLVKLSTEASSYRRALIVILDSITRTLASSSDDSLRLMLKTTKDDLERLL